MRVNEPYMNINLNDINYIINKAIYFNPGNRYRSVKDFIFDVNKVKAHEKLDKDGPLKKVFK